MAMQLLAPDFDLLAKLASDRFGATSFAELVELVSTGQAFTLQGHGLSLVAMPKRPELWIIAARGTSVDWPAVIPALDDVAKALDCTSVRFMGRRGWVRLLARYGYKETGVVLQKGV